MSIGIDIVKKDELFACLNGPVLLEFFRNFDKKTKLDNNFLKKLAEFIEEKESEGGIFKLLKLNNSEIAGGDEISKVDLAGICFAEGGESERKEIKGIIEEYFYDEKIFDKDFSFVRYLPFKNREKHAELNKTYKTFDEDFAGEPVKRKIFLFEFERKYQKENKSIAVDLGEDVTKTVNSFLLFRGIKHEYAKALLEYLIKKGMESDLSLLDEVDKIKKSVTRTPPGSSRFFSKTAFLQSFYNNLPYFIDSNLDIDKDGDFDKTTISIGIKNRQNGMVLNYYEALRKEFGNLLNLPLVRKFFEHNELDVSELKIDSFSYLALKTIIWGIIIKSFLDGLPEEFEEEAKRLKNKNLEKFFAYLAVISLIWTPMNKKTITKEKIDKKEVFKRNLKHFEKYVSLINEAGLTRDAYKVLSALKEDENSVDEQKKRELRSLFNEVLNNMKIITKGIVGLKIQSDNAYTFAFELRDEEIEELSDYAFERIRKEDKAYFDYVDKEKGRGFVLFKDVDDDGVKYMNAKVKISYSKSEEIFWVKEKGDIEEKLIITPNPDFEYTICNIGPVPFEKNLKEKINEGKYLFNFTDFYGAFKDSTHQKIALLIIALTVFYILKKRTEEKDSIIGILTLFDNDNETDSAMAFIKTMLNDASFIIPIKTKGLVKDYNSIDFRLSQSFFSMLTDSSYKRIVFKIKDYPYLKEVLKKKEEKLRFYLDESRKKTLVFYNYVVTFYNKTRANIRVLNGIREFENVRESGDAVCFVESFVSMVIPEKSEEKYSFIRLPIKKRFGIISKNDVDSILKGNSDAVKNFVSSYKKDLESDVCAYVESFGNTEWERTFDIDKESFLQDVKEAFDYIKVKSTPFVRNSKINKAFGKEEYEGRTDENNEGDWDFYVSALQILDNTELSKALKEISKKSSLLFKLNEKNVFVPINPEQLSGKGIYRKVIVVVYPRSGKRGFFLQDVDRLSILADGSRKKDNKSGRFFAFTLSYIGDLHDNSFSRTKTFDYKFSGKNELSEVAPLFALIVNS